MDRLTNLRAYGIITYMIPIILNLGGVVMQENDDILEAVGKGCKVVAKSVGTVALGAVGLLGLAGKAAGLDLGVAELSAEGIERLWASDDEKKQMDKNLASKMYRTAIMTCGQTDDDGQYESCFKSAWKAYQMIYSNLNLNEEQLYKNFKLDFERDVKNKNVGFSVCLTNQHSGMKGKKVHVRKKLQK